VTRTPDAAPAGRLLTGAEVARIFRVDPKTVTRWAAAERIFSIRTPGGHRRFPEAEVKAFLAGETSPGPRGRAPAPIPPG
jgi:excisionase family DNA binding protein